MKKLEKLKLHNLEEICVEDQKTMLGGSGSHLHWDRETGWTNMLDEVQCTGVSNYQPDWYLNIESGQIIVAGREGNIYNAFAEGNSSNITTPGEWAQIGAAALGAAALAVDVLLFKYFGSAPVQGQTVLQPDGSYVPPREY